MRKCGDCQLCCKLIPVRELHKAAGERCKHQRTGKGCMIYERRPPSCRAWNCQWLVDPDTANLSRPDRSHYCLDLLPDYVTMTYDDGRKPINILVTQIWVDPLYPDAHRDPALRAFMMKRGEQGMASIIRYSEREGFVIFPPNMASDGQWHEESSRTGFTRDKSLMDMVESGEVGMDLVFSNDDGSEIRTISAGSLPK